MTKSKERKTRQGTFRQDRNKKLHTLQPLTFIPKPLMDLNKYEHEYYNLCCEILLSNGTLTAADILGISRAAKTYGIYQKALEELANHGSYQTTKSGYTTKSGPFVVVADCEKLLTTFERSQGLNLISRSKLPEQKLSEFFTELDELINPAHKAGTPRNPHDKDFT